MQVVLNHYVCGKVLCSNKITTMLIYTALVSFLLCADTAGRYTDERLGRPSESIERWELVLREG